MVTARLAAALATLLVTAPARAQQCPDTPPDFRPHVGAGLDAERVPVQDDVVGRVWLVPVFCSDGPGPPPPRLADLRVVVVEGPEGTVGTTLRLRGRAERFRLRAPVAGRYVVKLESLRAPALEPARLTFRAFGASVPVRLRLVTSPLDRPRGVRARLRAEDGLATPFADAVRRGDAWELRLARVEPGRYRVLAAFDTRDRTSVPVTIPPGAPAPIDVAFPGAHVTVVADGRPADGREFEIRVEPADGAAFRVPLGDFGAELGGDVPPGRAVLHVRATRRVDPWNPDDPRHEWAEVARVETVVPPSAEHVLRWSMPRLLTGAPPRPGPWWEMPDEGRAARAADVAEGPRLAEVQGLALVPGGAVVLSDAAIFEKGAGWRRRAWRGAGEGVAIAARGLDAWAWIEKGGDAVLLRTPAGLALERFPTSAAGAPYPCRTTGIAVDTAGRLVVVGECRSNAPEGDSAPEEGYVATRDAEGWRVERGGWSRLRAVAFDGARFVAVGDDGQVLAGVPGRWSAFRAGDADLAGVSAATGRIVARTAEGRLLEVFDARPPVALAVPPDRAGPQAVAQHCLAGGRLIALLPRSRRPDEGGGRDPPERLAVVRADAAQVLEASETARVAALACDGQDAWVLEAPVEGGPTRLRRLVVAGPPVSVRSSPPPPRRSR